MVDSVNVGNDTNQDAADQQKAHDQKMAEAADRGVTSIRSSNSQTGENVDVTSTNGDQPGSDDKPTRPDDIPEKFWDAEKGEVNIAALLKAQQDAEAALRKGQTPPEPPKDDGKPPEGDIPQGETKEQQSAIDKASTEFSEKGELSDETYEELEKSGLPREMVDNYIAGQTAIAGQLTSAAYSAFDDGQEGFEAASTWAAQNLSDAEIEAIDVQLTSSNPSIVKEGAKALHAKYMADADIAPGTTVTGSGNKVAGDYFKSSTEMTAAMADSRYAKDPAYRSEVERKVARASEKGINLWG